MTFELCAKCFMSMTCQRQLSRQKVEKKGYDWFLLTGKILSLQKKTGPLRIQTKKLCQPEKKGYDWFLLTGKILSLQKKQDLSAFKRRNFVNQDQDDTAWPNKSKKL